MEVLKIEKLVGSSNWTQWKFQVSAVLDAREALEIANGTVKKPDNVGDTTYEERLKKWNKGNKIAKEIFATTLEKKPLALIMNCENSREMWIKLHDVYEQKSADSIYLVQSEFRNYRYVPGDDIASHISKIESFGRRLAELGEPVSDKMIITTILNTLPLEYRHFHSAWDSTPETERTLSRLISRLMVEETRLEISDLNISKNNDSALLADKHKTVANLNKVNKSSNFAEKNTLKCWNCGGSHLRRDCKHIVKTKQKYEYRRQFPLKNDTPVKCFFCGKIGHIKKNCYAYKKNQDDNNESGQAFITTVNKKFDFWIIDSGASHHICSDIKCFSLYKAFESPKPLTLGNGTHMYSKGTGDIKIEMLVNGMWKPGVLQNVWYVPESAQNLFSSGSALSHNLIEYATQNVREFKTERDETVAIGIKQPSGIYRLLMRVKYPETACVAVEKSDIQLWHERLGHQNYKHIQKVLKSQGIEVQVANELCDACVYGKMHRLPFRTRPNKPQEVGELISADLCGPMSDSSLGGSCYFLLFKDYFSKYRFVYFLKNKFEVAEKLKQFLVKVKNSGHTVKELLTDGGREFDNSQVNKILSDCGICPRKSMPYTPEQNGSIERENRTLVEAARAMLFARNLPRKLWAEAVNSAAYIINRTGPTKIDGKSPYELWHNKSPAIDHLKIFGTECFVHIPKQKRKKFDKKAVKGFLVGYCGNKDGYRVWIPQTDEIILSRDVVFKKETSSSIVLPDETKQSSNEMLLRDNLNDEGVCSETDVDDFGANPNMENSNSDDLEINESHSDTRSDKESDALTRTKCGRIVNKPKYLNDFELYTEYCLLTSSEPKTYKDAVKDVQWKEAVDKELISLKEMKTWEEAYLPRDAKAIDTKWVFRSKNNGIKKARLVAKGYQEEVNSEVYAPVAKLSTIRMMISLSLQKNWLIRQLDVPVAFLNGTLKNDVYIKPPDGVTLSNGNVLKLKRSLYGLKESPRCWNEKFNKFIEEQNFKRSKNDFCMYIKEDVIVVIYVDDILITGKESAINEVVSMLKKEFKTKDLGELNNYLGIEINRTADSIEIRQREMIKKILQRFNMENCKGSKTPIDSNLTISSSEEIVDNLPYRELIGSLMYISQGSRPDISFSVSFLSQYLDKPTISTWKAAKRVLRYLKETVDLALLYTKGKQELVAFSDSDWAGDKSTRKSVSGCVIFYYGNPVQWFSRKQGCVALSSCEAEYIAASAASAEVVSLSRVAADMEQDEPLRCDLNLDNQGAIHLTKSYDNSKRSKHIDIRYHFIKDLVDKGLVEVNYVPTEKNVSDILTKAVSFTKFVNLRSVLNLCV